MKNFIYKNNFLIFLQTLIYLIYTSKYFWSNYIPVSDEIDYLAHTNMMLERFELFGFTNYDVININIDRLPGFPIYLASVKYFYNFFYSAEQIFYVLIFSINFVLIFYSMTIIKKILTLINIHPTLILITCFLFLTNPTIIRFEISLLTEIFYFFLILATIDFIISSKKNLKVIDILRIITLPIIIIFLCLIKIHMIYFIYILASYLLYQILRKQKLYEVFGFIVVIFSILFVKTIIDQRINYVHEHIGFKIPSSLILLNFNSDMISQMIYYNDYSLTDKRIEDRSFAEEHNKKFVDNYEAKGISEAIEYSFKYRIDRANGLLLALTNNTFVQFFTPDYDYYFNTNIGYWYHKDKFTDIYYIIFDSLKNFTTESIIALLYYFLYTLIMGFGAYYLIKNHNISLVMILFIIMITTLLGPYQGILIGGEPRFRIPQIPLYSLIQAALVFKIISSAFFKKHFYDNS